MPNKITFDEAIATRSAPAVEQQTGITFDEALAARAGTAQPIGSGERPKVKGSRAFDLVPGEDGQLQTIQAAKPAENANFGASLKANLVDDPDTKRRLIAESLFPDDPNGIKRVGIIDGAHVYVDDSGQLRRVSPKLVSARAIATASLPEVAGAVAGSLTASPVAGAALGATAGKAAKQIVANTVFDEPQTPLGNTKALAFEGALNLATGGAAKGVTKFADRGKMVDFSPRDMKSAEQVRKYVKDTTGIDLDLAQASGDRKLIALRAYSARFPGPSADLVQAADEASQGQFEQATKRVLDRIAKAQPAEIAGANGVSAAQMAIRVAREKVQDDVRPLYKAAYDAVPEVKDEKILAMAKLPYFKQALRTAKRMMILENGADGKVAAKAVAPQDMLKSATTQADLDAAAQRLKLFEDDATPETATLEKLYELRRKELKGGGPTASASQSKSPEPAQFDAPSLHELDYAKRALDDQIDVLANKGRRREADLLRQRKNQFVEALDGLSNNQWKLARQRYGELAKSTIDPLEQGPVGVIAKIKNPKMAGAAAKIFNDANITPTQIAETKLVISAQEPEAWNGLVRTWLGQKLNTAMKETQTGSEVNAAGKFRQAVFGSPDDKEKLMAMLPKGAEQEIKNVMLAAQKLASTPIAGSNTMRDTEIKDQLKGTSAVIYRWLTSPRQSIRDAAEQRALENGTLAITEAIIDPVKRGQLRQVVKMAPSTKKVSMLSTIILGQATERAAASDADVLPPQLSQQ